MLVQETSLPEVKIVIYDMKTDNRGHSCPLYDKAQLEKAGIFFTYTTESVYVSEKAGTLYGIHFQTFPAAQAKMLYCIKGRGMDYAVDLRKNSANYLKWTSVELSAENRKQIYIPKGFGHAFLSLCDDTINVIRCDVPPDPRYRGHLRYDEPAIGIKYPDIPLILAPHDADAPYLDDCFTDM